MNADISNYNKYELIVDSAALNLNKCINLYNSIVNNTIKGVISSILPRCKSLSSDMLSTEVRTIIVTECQSKISSPLYRLTIAVNRVVATSDLKKYTEV